MRYQSNEPTPAGPKFSPFECFSEETPSRLVSLGDRESDKLSSGWRSMKALLVCYANR